MVGLQGSYLPSRNAVRRAGKRPAGSISFRAKMPKRDRRGTTLGLAKLDTGKACYFSLLHGEAVRLMLPAALSSIRGAMRSYCRRQHPDAGRRL